MAGSKRENTMTSRAHPWQSIELALRSAATAWANAYADCDVWAVFRHDDQMVFQLQLAKDRYATPETRDYMVDWERAHA